MAVILRLYIGYKQDRQFEAQKLGVNLKELKVEWGKPDKEYFGKDYQDSIVLSYDCYDFWGHNYIFLFDKKSQKLTFKYYDD